MSGVSPGSDLILVRIRDNPKGIVSLPELESGREIREFSGGVTTDQSFEIWQTRVVSTEEEEARKSVCL